MELIYYFLFVHISRVPREMEGNSCCSGPKGRVVIKSGGSQTCGSPIDTGESVGVSHAQKIVLTGVYSVSINDYDKEVDGFLHLGEEFISKSNLGRSMSQRVYKISNGFYVARKEKLEVKMHAYFDKVIDYGVIEITNLAKYLQKEFVLDANVTNTLNKKVNDYKQKINNHITIILKQQIKCKLTDIVQREFMFLDITSFSNKLLQNNAKKMLDKVLESEYNRNKKDAVKNVNDLIHKTQIRHMKDIMNYMCVKIDVCRPFPAFTDSIADLITELLRLNDKKLLHLLKYVKTKIEDRLNFFKTFVKQNVLEIITLQIGNIYEQDMYIKRNFLEAVSSSLIYRYTMQVTDHDEIILQSTATFMFLDIINSAFAKETNDLTKITFDTTIKAIKAWKKGDRQEIKMPVKLLFDHVTMILRQNWNLATRQEVMTLTEVMVMGQSDDDGFNELLTLGSEFIQDGIRPVLQ